MRMRPIVLAACLSAGTAFAAPPAAQPTQPAQPAAQSQAETCMPLPSRRYATVQNAAPRRLGDLPPGNLELAVLRSAGNCMIPAIVQEGFDAGGRRERR